MSRARLDADDAASLLRELAWLRKRGGFTAARLVRAPIVDEVLRGSLEDSFERLRHRFVSAIHSLSESGSEQDEPLVGVLLATIQVRFIGEMPSSIWQFTGASPFARPQAANQYNRTSLDTQQRATLTQRDVHSGLFGGFGWEW